MTIRNSKAFFLKTTLAPRSISVASANLLDIISNIGQDENPERRKDLLGRSYEYFLGKFASAEGKRGGEFYTPCSQSSSFWSRCSSPYHGRIYDPCCGSGGMFVQSEKFVLHHGGRIGDVAVYGQEMNANTWKLAKMNLAIHGIDSNLGPQNTPIRFTMTCTRTSKPILSSPIRRSTSAIGAANSCVNDVRWKYGAPPAGNANYAWIQHMLHHLAPARFAAGFVLANGSMSSNSSGEGEIRRALIEADLVDCMVALPGQLFFTTQIPVCLWFLTRSKSTKDKRDRRGETLFIDARQLGTMESRVLRTLTEDDIAKIAGTYHAWRGDKDSADYADIPGFCKSALASRNRRPRPRPHPRPLRRGRGHRRQRRRAVRLKRWRGSPTQLEEQFTESARLQDEIRANSESNWDFANSRSGSNSIDDTVSHQNYRSTDQATCDSAFLIEDMPEAEMAEARRPLEAHRRTKAVREALARGSSTVSITRTRPLGLAQESRRCSAPAKALRDYHSSFSGSSVKA